MTQSAPAGERDSEAGFAPVYDMLHHRVARNVRAEAARYGDTQIAVGAALGIASQNISNRMRGRTPFGLDELEVLAERYGLTPGQLVDGSAHGTKWAGSDVVRREGIEPPTR